MSRKTASLEFALHFCKYLLGYFKPMELKMYTFLDIKSIVGYVDAYFSCMLFCAPFHITTCV